MKSATFPAGLGLTLCLYAASASAAPTVTIHNEWFDAWEGITIAEDLWGPNRKIIGQLSTEYAGSMRYGPQEIVLSSAGSVPDYYSAHAEIWLSESPGELSPPPGYKTALGLGLLADDFGNAFVELAARTSLVLQVGGEPVPLLTGYLSVPGVAAAGTLVIYDMSAGYDLLREGPAYWWQHDLVLQPDHTYAVWSQFLADEGSGDGVGGYYACVPEATLISYAPGCTSVEVVPLPGTAALWLAALGAAVCRRRFEGRSGKAGAGTSFGTS